MKKNHQKLPVFSNKMKTKTYIKILRQTSLEGNVMTAHRKFQFEKMYIHRDICVQQIKVKKSLFN